MHNHEIYFFLTLPNEQCRETFHPSALPNKGKQYDEPGRGGKKSTWPELSQEEINCEGTVIEQSEFKINDRA